MKITAAMLRGKGACAKQVALFEELFGAEVTVTEALCVEHASKFNWDWAAMELLNPEAWRAFDEAVAGPRRAFDEAVAGAWRAFDEARAVAFARGALSQEGN